MRGANLFEHKAGTSKLVHLHSEDDKVELAELTELFEAVAAAARKELVESTR